MLEVCLFAFVPDWVRTWLTPLWLLGLGTIAGLALLLLLWGLLWLLSRIPAISWLSENSGSRRVMTIVLGLLTSGLAGGYLLFGQGAGVQEGALALILIMAASFGLSYVCVAYLSRRNMAEVPLAVGEGVLAPMLVIAAVLVLLGVLGSAVVRNPGQILASLQRLPSSGERELEFPIAAPVPGLAVEDVAPQEVTVGLRRSELRALLIQSDETVEVTAQPEPEVGFAPTISVGAGEDYRWVRGQAIDEAFKDEEIAKLYVRNLGASPAKLVVRAQVVPEFPEVATIPMTAVAFAGLVLFYFLHRAAMPKASAVALATTKSEVAQPLYSILLILGIASLGLFIWIPYNTFGEDIKMLKDSGLVLIMVLGIIQAVWAASTSVADEIEGRTALTVLSKPLGRQSFIIGKFLGIFWSVALLFIILSVVFLIVVSYKPIYDALETAEEAPTWQICHFEVVRLVPGLVLAFMETILLAAISVAISTRLPMLANFVICFSIYVLGHLTPLLVQSSVAAEAFEPVVFVARFIAVIFPVLDHFNIQPAVAAGIGVPYDYLGWALLYCSVYGMIALLLALLMFEDRDLA